MVHLRKYKVIYNNGMYESFEYATSPEEIEKHWDDERFGEINLIEEAT